MTTSFRVAWWKFLGLSEADIAGKLGARCGKAALLAKFNYPPPPTPGICCSIECNTQWQQQLRDALTFGVSNIYEYEDSFIKDRQCPVCYKETTE